MPHIVYSLTGDHLTVTVACFRPGDRIVIRGRHAARRRDGRTRGRRTRAVIQKPQHVKIRLDENPPITP